MQFDIKRAAVARYFFSCWTILAVFLSGMSSLVAFLIARENYEIEDFLEVSPPFFAAGVGLVLLITLEILFKVVSSAQARALSYRLEKGTLHVDSGFLFLSRRAIPLDRVTDIVLRRGPLMAICGIWGIGVQTSGSTELEANLYGLEEPEKVRDFLLAERDKAATNALP
ncbi:MAG: hypothetical protein Kow00107_03530 [Planctomycetota bacterium]